MIPYAILISLQLPIQPKICYIFFLFFFFCYSLSPVFLILLLQIQFIDFRSFYGFDVKTHLNKNRNNRVQFHLHFITVLQTIISYRNMNILCVTKKKFIFGWINLCIPNENDSINFGSIK